jgi:YD repeat-containing protein
VNPLCAVEYPVSCAPPARWLATEFSTSGTGIAPITSTREYIGPKTDLRGEGWLGFDTVIENTVTAVDRRDYSPVTNYGSVYPFRRRLAQEVRYAQTRTGAIVRKDLYQYKFVDSGFAPPPQGATYTTATYRLPAVMTAVVTSEVTERTKGAPPVLIYGVRKTADTVDTFGNVLIARSEYGWPQTVETTTATSSFDNDDVGWILGLRRQITLRSTTPAGEVSERAASFTYDPATGSMVTSVREPQGAADLRQDTRYIRNDFGQIVRTESTDLLGNLRADDVQYDDVDSTFSVRTSDALGHTTTSLRHPSLGVTVQETDANGQRLFGTYDGFGRRLKQSIEGGLTTRTRYDVDSTGWDRVTTTGNDGSDESLLTDAFGRGRSSKSRAFDGTASFVETEYDARFPSKPSSRTQPPFASSLPSKSHFSYDSVGRLVQLDIDGRGTTLHRFHGTTETVVDPEGHTTSIIGDVAGRSISTTELAKKKSSGSGSVITRSFVYGPFSAMRVSESRNYSTVRTFDAAGRLQSTSDPDTGLTSFSYNAFDEIIHVETGKSSSTIDIRRDRIGREIGRVSSIDGTSCRRWDAAPHGIGALTSVTSADGVTQSFLYDSLGRRRSETWTVDSEVFTQTTRYDGIGRLAAVD